MGVKLPLHRVYCIVLFHIMRFPTFPLGKVMIWIKHEDMYSRKKFILLHIV